MNIMKDFFSLPLIFMIFESQEEEDKIRYRFFEIKRNFQFHKLYKPCLIPISVGYQ